VYKNVIARDINRPNLRVDIVRFIHKITLEDEGASTVEYAVLLALIIAICIAVIAVIGTKTSGLYETVNTIFG
jgi:Flp pilus assembly pilin Flp